MLIALLLAQLTSPALPRPQGPIYVSSRAATYVPADVEFARSGSSLGMTPEYACTQPSVTFPGGGSAAVTTNRSTAAFCTKADYSDVLCPANTARMMTGGGSAPPLGLMYEFYLTQNDALQNRDWSNAAWVKTNMTCTKTAAGSDLVASSATTCTATAANATVLQTVAGTGQKAVSLKVKRRTGTGPIDVTVDGTTFTSITSRVATGFYKRVVSAETVGCMNGGCIVVRAMAANFASAPVIGIRLGTSGDAVDVDLAQVEGVVAGGGGQFSTSPIVTAGAAQQRGAETHSATVPAFTARSASNMIMATGQTFKYDISSSAQKDVNNEFLTSLDTSYGPLAMSPFCVWVNAGSLQEQYGTEVAPTIGPVWTSCFNDGTTVGVSLAGAGTTAVATVQPATALTTLWLGSRAGGAGGAVLSNGCWSSVATKCSATRNVAPNAIAWIGDSISAGSTSAPTMPPAELSQMLGRTVYNKGFPGENVTFCANKYLSAVQGKNFSTLVYGCGTNDTIGGGGGPAGAAAWLVSQGTLEQALLDGLKVVTFNILPYGGAPSWNTNKQQAIDAYNSGWATWCAGKVGNPKVACVDAYAAFGGQGGDPKVMLTIYDSGDQRHPNALGSTYLASIVAAGNP